jgi:hypothetical protein
MKIAHAVAAASLLALAGCAGVPSPLKQQPTTAVATSGTYYCWQQRLEDTGSGLRCNWERSQTDACESHAVVTLAKNAVSGTPQRVHYCTNGQWIVSVTSG